MSVWKAAAVIAFGLLASMAAAGEPSGLEGRDRALLRRVQAHPGIKAGGIGLIRTDDGRSVLVAVGVADLVGKDRRALADAEKAAELDAHVKIGAFAGGEHVTAMSRSSLTVESGSSESLSETYEEKMTGAVDCLVIGARVIGTYLSDDSTRLYAAVVLDKEVLGASPLPIDGFPLFPRSVIARGVAKTTGDKTQDLDTALRDAMLRAQLTAGGASVFSVRQLQNDRPFRYLEQVEANGWVDSFEILSETRGQDQTEVVIRAVVVADPARVRGPRTSPDRTRPPTSKPLARKASGRSDVAKKEGA